ncbi:MAG TPA: protein kinase [Bryobacteraceae bacterium]|nr:protein kinase [Bryobacteraceae bacterium]
MTDNQWARIESCYTSLSELPPGEWTAALAAIDDREVRDEVAALLSRPDTAPTLANIVSAMAGAAGAEAATQRFGPYRVTGTIGQGGMGAVYAAVRDDQVYEKQVAIKVLHLGLDTDSAKERFRQERQILAGLEHPYIARMLDGGETPTGVSYIVMEHVDGENIASYCKRSDLSRDERLRLFLKVCEAVQFAHQNLIVHRDLKPGNIMVTNDGTPKLLDFGIAKLIDPSSDRTATKVQALTPNYASPEQVRGLSISTASDVYSLGVVLYELLTGRLPYQIPTLTPLDIDRAVCETQPDAPEISSDLDKIILMALRKEASRRYGSVEQFAQDIERFLDHRPVTAQADTAWYRTAKFVRRNWVALLSGTIAALGLCIGAGIAIYQARIAQHRFNDVRKLANTFLFDFEEKIRDLPGSTAARQMVVSTGLTYLDSLARDAGRDKGLQEELAHAYERVGDVQGRDDSFEDLKGAAASYDKSIALSEALAKKNPRDATILRALAATYARLSRIKSAQLDRPGAKENARQCIASLEGAGRLQPDAGDLMPLGSCYQAMATAQLGMDDVAGAVDSTRHLLDTRQEMAKSNPTPDRLLRVAISLDLYADALYQRGDLSGALKSYTEAQQIVERLVRENPISTGFRNVLAEIDESIGTFYFDWFEDPEACVAWHVKAIDVQHKISVSDPANQYSQSQEAVWVSNFARCFIETNPREALAQNERAIGLAEPLLQATPDSRRERLRKSISLAQLAQAASRLGQKEKALRAIHEAVAMQVHDRGVTPSDGRQRRGLAGYFRDQAEVEFRLGNYQAAIDSYKEAQRLFESGSSMSPFLDAYEDLGDLYRSAGKAYGALSKDSRTPASVRAGYAQESLALWRKSLEVWKRWPSVGVKNAFVDKRTAEAMRAVAGAGRQ